MDSSSKPAAFTGAARSASFHGKAPTAPSPLDTNSAANQATAKAPLQTPVPPLFTPPLNASASTSDTGNAPMPAPRFMMRRSGGGKMTPINKQPSTNGNSPSKYEATRPLTNGVKPRSSLRDILEIKSDIDGSYRRTSWSFTSTSQNHGEKRQNSAEAEGHPNAKRTKGGSSTTDYIPPHLTTALDGRKYCHFKTSIGGLLDTYGALIPGGYATDVFSEKPWPCPVVGCGTSFGDLPSLGHHFKREHQSTTFHDNNDGTLTKKGTYGNKSPASCAIVVTQEKPKTYATAVAAPIKIVLSDPQPAAPSADAPDDDPPQDPDSDDDPFDISHHSSPQPSGEKSHVSRPEGPRGGSGESADRRSDEDSDPAGDSDPAQEHGAGLSDIPDKASGKSPPDRAASRSTQQPSATEPSAAAAAAAPAVLPKAIGTEMAVKSKNGDFSAPMPANIDLMWKYVQQFTVVHRGEIPEKMYVRDFLSLRRLRALEWNDAWIASHRFKDSVARDVSSMIMQITGPYAPNPCTRCKGGHGPYKGCVTMPPDAPVHTQFMIYGCANCVYHGRQTHCSLQAQCKKETAQRFPHVDPAKVRAEVYSSANAAAGRLSAQSKQKAKAALQAQKNSPRVERPEACEAEESLNLAAAAAAAAAEWPTRSRVAKAPNYNLKDLSRPSRHRVAAPSRSVSAAEEATETAKGPDEADAGTPMDGVEAPVPDLPTRDRLIRDSDKTSATQEKSVSEDQYRQTGPNRESHAAGQRDVGRAMVPLGSGLGGTIEMEDWEFGPGVILNDDGSDNIAFSSAYLTGQKLVPVAHGVSCRVEFVKPGCSLSLSPDARCTRMCTIIAGRVRVQSGDMTFSIGFGGNVKILPGVSAVLQNRLYIDAYLQIMSVPE